MDTKPHIQAYQIPRLPFSSEHVIGKTAVTYTFYYLMIDNEKSITETLNQILLLLQSQEERIAAHSTSPLYDNKALMTLLGIKDRYLKRLRDKGLLGYSRHGDKYWYTQADVDRFLARCHFATFGAK